MNTPTPEEWASRVRLYLRRLGSDEQAPHSVTDFPAQYEAIVEVIREAIAAERERCAELPKELEKKCDRMAVIGGPEEEPGAGPDFFSGYRVALDDFAAAIRRGNQL